MAGPGLRAYSALPVWVVEEHNDVLPHIYRAMGSRHLPMEGLTLLHVDAHPDLLLPVSLPARTVRDPRALFSELSIENWVLPAVFAGHVARVVWVRPPWARTMREGRHDFCVGRDPEGGTIRVSSTESYFLSDGLYLPEGRLEEAKPLALEVVTLPLDAADAGATTEVPAGRKRRHEWEEGGPAAPPKAALLEPGPALEQAAASVSDPQTSADKTSHRQQGQPGQPASPKQETSPGQQTSRDTTPQRRRATPGPATEAGQPTRPKQETSPEPPTPPATEDTQSAKPRRSSDSKTATAGSGTSPPAGETTTTTRADGRLVSPEGGPAGPPGGPVPPGATAAANGLRDPSGADGAGRRWRGGGGVRAAALRLLDACPGDGAALVLDIDLDFFSVKNPFREIYTPAELALLHELYAFSRPDDDSEEALVSAVRRRQRRLEELELTFVELSRDDGPHSLDALGSDPRWPSLVKLVRSLQGRLQERPDYEMVHQAGLTCDDQELPHHVTSPAELSGLLLGLRDTLCVLPPPTIVTMARSSLDDYCPPDQVEEIQERVLDMLEDLYGDLEVHTEY